MKIWLYCSQEMSPAPLAPQSFQEVPVNSVGGARSWQNRETQRKRGYEWEWAMGSVYLCPSLYLGVQCVLRVLVRVHACKCVSGWHVSCSCSVNSNSVSISLTC